MKPLLSRKQYILCHEVMQVNNNNNKKNNDLACIWPLLEDLLVIDIFSSLSVDSVRAWFGAKSIAWVVW